MPPRKVSPAAWTGRRRFPPTLTERVSTRRRLSRAMQLRWNEDQVTLRRRKDRSDA